jgi:hypothetical protein
MAVNIALRLGSALLWLAAGFAQRSRAPLAITISPSSDGISVGGDEFKAGAGVRVIVTLTNVSNRDVTLHLTSPMCDYAVEVRDSTGGLARDTEHKRTANCSGRTLGRNVYEIVRPNESAEDVINVSRMSDVSQPGKYLVQVMLKLPEEPGHVVVNSNTITITVMP